MHHIIIEGPDGAGKTKLAQRLCAEQGLAYRHEGPPPLGDALPYYAGLFANASEPTVFDRFHIGELVYGPLLRGESRLSPHGLRLMNRLVSGTGSSVVLCLPSWETCRANSICRREMIEAEADRRTAYERWHALPITTFVNLTPHDYTRHEPIRIEEHPTCPDGVVGSPYARVLFVGEQPNGQLDLPFFGTGHSSIFLNGCIADADLREREIAFTNAFTANGTRRNIDLLIEKMFYLEVVVPLGRVAEALCTHLPFSRPIPHPQYWKRFRSRDRAGYIALIQEACR